MKNIVSLCGKHLLIVAILSSSCENYVEIDPPKTYVASDHVFSNEKLAIAAVEGIYHQLYNSTGFASGWQNSVTVLSALSADDLNVGPFSLSMEQFYDNEIIPSNNYCQQLWSSAY